MPIAIDPAINMWDGKWDHLRQLEGYRSAPSYPAYQNALPGIVGGIRSPWTLPLPDPFSFSPSGLNGPSFSGDWESLGENAGEWNEPRYVQPCPQRPQIRSQPFRVQESENVFGTSTPNHEIPSARSAHPTRHMAHPDASVRSLCTGTAGTAGLGSFKSSTSVRDDPGLSGQRLKRVLHVKQAPIYKYSLWTSHWIEQGGRKSGDPMTPRSELTKSEFDIQYGAWRKALVEGPPQKKHEKLC